MSTPGPSNRQSSVAQGSSRGQGDAQSVGDDNVSIGSDNVFVKGTKFFWTDRGNNRWNGFVGDVAYFNIQWGLDENTTSGELWDVINTERRWKGRKFMAVPPGGEEPEPRNLPTGTKKRQRPEDQPDERERAEKRAEDMRLLAELEAQLARKTVERKEAEKRAAAAKKMCFDQFKIARDACEKFGAAVEGIRMGLEDDGLMDDKA